MKNKYFVTFVMVAAVAAGMFFLPDVLAQATADGAASTAADTVGADGAGMGWKQMIDSGGWLMYVLGVMSIIMLAFIIYFCVVLRPGQIVPRPLFRELVEKIRAGLIDEAIKACDYHPSPLSSIALIAMEHKKKDPDIDAMLLKDIVESEGERQGDLIQGQTQYLLDIGVIAPMVGLLGTVFGILRAFSGLLVTAEGSRPLLLAEGISKALITTASGLMVAIPAMVAYSLFRRKASRLVASLETAATEILTLLSSKEK